MMNQTEFAEFARVLLKEHTVELFCDEGSVDSYSLAEVKDFVDTVFDLEASAIDVFHNMQNVGGIWFLMDNSPSKGVYVEISGSSDNDEINALVAVANRYIPK